MLPHHQLESEDEMEAELEYVAHQRRAVAQQEAEMAEADFDQAQMPQDYEQTPIDALAEHLQLLSTTDIRRRWDVCAREAVDAQEEEEPPEVQMLDAAPVKSQSTTDFSPI